MKPIFEGCSDCKWTPQPVHDATPSSKNDSTATFFTGVGSAILVWSSDRRFAVGAKELIFLELMRGFRGKLRSLGAASTPNSRKNKFGHVIHEFKPSAKTFGCTFVSLEFFGLSIIL
jgi:hypothetical protein